MTATTKSDVSKSNDTTAAFWEFDLSPPPQSNSSSNNNNKMQPPPDFISTWLQTQISTAVTQAVAKLPFTNHDNNDHHQQQIPNNITGILLSNITTAVQSLRVAEAPAGDGNMDDDDDDNTDGDYYHDHNTSHRHNNNDKGDTTAHARKRQKTVIRRSLLLHDPYHIWFQRSPSGEDDINHNNNDSNNNVNNNNHSTSTVLWNEEQDDMPTVFGGKLAILSAGGLLNAISLSHLCTTPVLPHSSKLLLQQAVRSNAISQWKQLQQQHQPDLAPVTVGHLYQIATSLHVAIAEQVKYDIVRTTPTRIQLLLASDLTASEFQSVRRRLHDTVILGKGVQQQQSSSSTSSDDQNNDTTLAVGAATQQHAIDKYKKCPGCGNNDQSEFVLDRKNGDLICANCGIVVSESIMHEGSQFRKFEGEVDRNHHGDAGNPLYSNAHNMGTSLSTIMPTTGAGMGGRGSGEGGRRNMETILRNAHAYTELNVSQFGRTDVGRTRVGYKDRQKKAAFSQMTHAGDALNLHEAVVQRAKELFAGKEHPRLI